MLRLQHHKFLKDFSQILNLSLIFEKLGFIFLIIGLHEFSHAFPFILLGGSSTFFISEDFTFMILPFRLMTLVSIDSLTGTEFAYVSIFSSIFSFFTTTILILKSKFKNNKEWFLLNLLFSSTDLLGSFVFIMELII